MEKTAGPTDDSLAGKLFVLTGTLAAYSRDEARAAIEARGGRVTSSVSKKTDYVVSRAKRRDLSWTRRTELGVTVIDEAAFKELLK